MVIGPLGKQRDLVDEAHGIHEVSKNERLGYFFSFSLPAFQVFEAGRNFLFGQKSHKFFPDGVGTPPRDYIPGGVSIPSKYAKPSSETVFIGLGANLGPVRSNFARAARSISKISRVLAVSSLYESDPVGVKNQPKFTNAVLKAETELDPFELLDFLKAVEKEIGRKKTDKWGPRVIDLDIILYGNLVVNAGSLMIPHPEAHERRFVLEPLLEIEPEAAHPATGSPLKEALERIGGSQAVSKIEDAGAFFRP